MDSARALYILTSNKGESEAASRYEFRRPAMLLFSKKIESKEAAERLGEDKSVKVRETRHLNGVWATTTTKLAGADDLKTFLEIEDRTRTPTTSLARIGRMFDKIEGIGGPNYVKSLGVAKDGALDKGFRDSFERLSPLEAAKLLEAGGSIAVVNESVHVEKGMYGVTITTTAIASNCVISTPDDLEKYISQYGLDK